MLTRSPGNGTGITRFMLPGSVCLINCRGGSGPGVRQQPFAASAVRTASFWPRTVASSEASIPSP